MNVKIAGIIAEYNPLHRGHITHIEQTRLAAQCDYVVAVLGGFFTQRGEPALMDKFARVRMALLAGADAVVELPCVYALRSAQIFARGGIGILTALGANCVSFGCENPDLPALEALADLMETEEMNAALRERLREGKAYPRAVAEAAEELSPAGAGLLDKPNNALALEYLREIRRGGSSLAPVAIPRREEYHDESTLFSATGVRKLLREGKTEAACEGLPGGIADIYREEAKGGLCNYEALSPLLLTLLRRLPDNAAAPDGGEGLEKRLADCARESGSIGELLDKAKCKRYTRARLSRAAAQLLLDLPDTPAEIPYLRLLGMKKDAAPLISELNRRSGGSLCADAVKLAGNPTFDTECRCADLWGLGTQRPEYRVAGREFRQKFIKL